MNVVSRAIRQIDRIGGTEQEPSGLLPLWLCNPSTGARIMQAAATDLVEVERAIAIADEAHSSGIWSGLTIDERSTYLMRVADLLDPYAEDVAAAEAIGSGVVISVTELFAGALAGSFRQAVELIADGWSHTDLSEDGRRIELLRLPWGPTAVLVPWNAPAAMAAKKVAFALAAGAPVILKPPEWAPFGCNFLADAIGAARLPRGVFQMVHGGVDVGQLLTTDPRIRAVSFTGSVRTGRSIARAGAEDFKALQLELGGNNPVVVRADADIEETARALAEGIVKLNGQWCEGPGKIFVPRARHDEFVEALQAHLQEYVIGAHDDPSAQIGPLAHEAHRNHLNDQVQRMVDLGAQVVMGGVEPDLDGWFWAPRVVVGAAPADCIDELFGPVVTVHPVDSDSEAVALANNSPYGLAGYVFGTDIEAAMSVGRDMRFGEVKVNGTSILDLSPSSVQSFWRSSGLGGHGDRDTIRFFCGAQIVGVDKTGLPI